MSFNKSSLRHQNLTTKLNHNATESSNRYEYVYLIILSILLFILSILIFLICTKYKRKKRQKNVINNHFEPKLDDAHMILLPENTNGKINNDNIIPNSNINTPRDSTIPLASQENSTTNSMNEINDNIDNSVLTDPPEGSTIPSASQRKLTTNSMHKTDDNDDLSDIDFSNIPLRPVPSSQSSSESIDRSSDKLYENPYLKEYKLQEKEEAEARKPPLDIKVSADSSSSEESCV